jgi:hypothetical protein
MSPEIKYHAEKLRNLLLEERIATMEQLKQSLGTDTDLTVFRKLKELSYHTSYSHQGRYYTLDEIARFDELGLWSYESVWFSKHGTLVRTVEVLVETSQTGHFATELDCILNVSTKDALRKLFEQNRLSRQQVQNRWLYCSSDPHRQQQQLKLRRFDEEDPLEQELFPEELKTAIVLFFSLLNEKQRRLYAGLEAFKWGHGGDRMISRLLGIDEQTVARGRQELITQDVDSERIRKPGGGRKPLKKGRQK